MLMVKHIENGTVIDHVPAGKALDILRVISSINGNTVVIAMNVKSTKHGAKDILKIENIYIDKERADLISLVAPGATINVIKSGKVADKLKAQTPKEINGVLKCLNPKCITNSPREPLKTKFFVSDNPITLQCAYCSKEFGEELLSEV